MLAMGGASLPWLASREDTLRISAARKKARREYARLIQDAFPGGDYSERLAREISRAREEGRLGDVADTIAELTAFENAIFAIKHLGA